jgi:predicted N-acetyltransferase YhbS
LAIPTKNTSNQSGVGFRVIDPPATNTSLPGKVGWQLNQEIEKDNMEFRSINSGDYEVVRQFLIEAGWERRVADPRKFKKMMKNTSRTVAAFEGLRLVGFARALCDEVSNGYISMVAVAADKRGQGIGRELVRQLIKDDTNITWILRAGHGSDGFWTKMGFTPSGVAMERCRR